MSSATDMDSSVLLEWLRAGATTLFKDDPILAALLAGEHHRQDRVLQMIASSSPPEPSVLVCEAMRIGATTLEGYPGARYHGGGELVDELERVAIARACAAFGGRFANVQPHSGTSANLAVLVGLAPVGSTILGMDARAGGHLTHGAPVSVTGKAFTGVAYGVDESGRLDLAEVRRLAKLHQPRVIVAGASAYPRTIDFAEFRAIADECGAYLLADIAHIAGLVIAGEHPSPIDVAHVTTTSTYKQLRGPRGGLILSGRDASLVADSCDAGVFPGTQGTPHLGIIAAKARCLELARAPRFAACMARVRESAATLASRLVEHGHRLATGGTDNHLVLVDVTPLGLTGGAAERALEQCGIITNRNRIPLDPRSPRIGSGVRLGANEMGFRGFDDSDARLCGDLVDRVLRAANEAGEVDPEVRRDVLGSVHELLRARPLETLLLEGADAR